MRDRSVTRSRIMVGGLVLLIAACSSPRVTGEGAGTSTAPAAAADLSAGSADQAEYNNGVTVVPAAKQYVSARQLALREAGRAEPPVQSHDGVAARHHRFTPDGYVSGNWWGVTTQFGDGWVDSAGLSPSSWPHRSDVP